MRFASRPPRTQSGFSLLEMVVAVAMLALALGVMYQAVSGATRNVRSDERYAYGIELARSLLANHSVVPAKGVNQRGETEGGFHWAVLSQPAQLPEEVAKQVSLHDITVTVAWPDGQRNAQISLFSVVEARRQ